MGLLYVDDLSITVTTFVLLIVERFHVLLLQSNGSLRPKIPEGSYDLCFRDSLLLKDGPRAIEAWAYNEITW